MVRRPAARLAAVLAVLVAGCSACSAHSAGPGGHVPPLPPAGPVTVARGLPGCSTTTAQARALGLAGASLRPVPAWPFGVVATADGHWSFLSAGPGVAVLRTGGPSGPAVVRTIPLPSATALGEALTRDGRYLLVAGLRGAEVIDMARAEQGSPHAVLGTLVIPGGMGGIEVALSPDDQYAFVSMEYTGEIAVFSLRRALADGFRPSDLVGAIRAGHAPVGLAVSPDGRWLYSTSEVEAGTSPSPVPGGHSLVRGGSRIVVADSNRFAVRGASSSLAVLSVTAALAGRPAVIGYLRAGGFPREMALEPDGRTLLVTNFNSGQLESVHVAGLP